eukprot:1103001-Pyramimonas_sp.AAC.1
MCFRGLQVLHAMRGIQGSTWTCDVRKELAGELNYRVTRWLDKVLMVHFTVSVSSPSVELVQVILKSGLRSTTL